MDNKQQAIEYYLKAISIREQKLGVFHLKTADSYYNIAVVYNSLSSK